LGRVWPGFDPRDVLTFHICNIWGEAGGKPGRQRTDRLLDALRSVPGVEAATVAMSLPGVPGEYEVELKTTEGRAETEPRMIAQGRFVTPEYFSVMRIPLLSGELCRADPDLPIAMVNRSFANLYLSGQAAIGRHILKPANRFLRPAEIRGIVGDVREIGLDREPPPTAYWCVGAMQPGTFFLIRVHGDTGFLTASIRRKIHEVEPLRSVYDLSPLTSHISDGYAENRLRLILLTFFALTAVALASVGLYGTLSYVVNTRRCEVAVRMALGALRIEVASKFLKQGLLVTAAGCMAGVALAAPFTQTLSGMLYGVTPTDVATLAGVVITVLAVSVAASLLPAIRAARFEPMRSLREE
jgi:hypothetical protein